MPRRKPLGWPRLMVAKRLLSGTTAYYWSPPTWALKAGCPVHREALGTDFAEAKQRCDELLLPAYDGWRNGADNAEPRSAPGTFDWLASIFRDSPRFRDLAVGTKVDYDRALSAVADFRLKDGRRFGSLGLRSITPGAADLLHEKILAGGRGARARTAKLCMDVCRRAWGVAYRQNPGLVPASNPFARMHIRYAPASNRAATYAELMTFVVKADALGFASLGTAAMIGFFWLQRAEDIFVRLTWSDYRPASDPESIHVWHHKNHGERLRLPLIDEDGTELWPELIERLDNAPKTGVLVVMRDGRDRKRGEYMPWATSANNPLRHVQRVVRRICDQAGLPRDLTFTSFRHGGHTEGADAELTDAQMRALGGHRSTAALLRYAKETDRQRRAGARKRLEARRTKGGGLSE